MSDAEIPDWYRRYAVGAGRLVCYALGLYMLVSPLVQMTARDLLVVPLRDEQWWRIALGAAVASAAALFAVRRTVPGYRVFQFGFVTLLSVNALRGLLDTGSLAAGSPLLWLDAGLVALTSVAVAYELVFGGLAGEAVAAARERLRAVRSRQGEGD